MTIGLSLGQIGDSKRGTLLLSKLLQANQFDDLDNSEDEDGDQDSQMQTLNHAENVEL